MRIETAELIRFILISEIRNMKVLKLAKWNEKYRIEDLEQALKDIEIALEYLKS